MKCCSFIGLCALLILVFSCSGTNLKNYDGFQETVMVETRQQDFDSVYMMYPYRVRLHDSTLYVMDLHGKDFFCHEFSYPSCRYRKSFAPRGKGPGQLLSIGNIAVNDQGEIFVLGDYSRKIYNVDSGNNQLLTITELSDDILFYPDFVLYDDSTYIIPDYYGKCRFFFADRNGAISNQSGSIYNKKEMSRVPEAALGHAWRSFIGYNQHNGILALVAQLGEVIEIYDLNNGAVTVKIGPGGLPKCRYKGNNAIPTGLNCYSDVFVGDRYIYALYWGHEFEKIATNEISVEGGMFVHVFDLQGNPVKRYQLDRYITGLFIDEKNRLAIGTDVNEEQLVMFNL